VLKDSSLCILRALALYSVNESFETLLYSLINVFVLEELIFSESLEFLKEKTETLRFESLISFYYVWRRLAFLSNYIKIKIITTQWLHIILHFDIFVF